MTENLPQLLSYTDPESSETSSREMLKHYAKAYNFQTIEESKVKKKSWKKPEVSKMPNLYWKKDKNYVLFFLRNYASNNWVEWNIYSVKGKQKNKQMKNNQPQMFCPVKLSFKSPFLRLIEMEKNFLLVDLLYSKCF